jgi:hypothetical protein
MCRRRDRICLWLRQRQVPVRADREQERKKEFVSQVRACLSSDFDTGNLRLSRIRSFACRQRRYICAYDLLYKQESERRQDPETAESDEIKVEPTIIERYVKNFKSHLSIFDSERGYLGDCLREDSSIGK